MDIFMAVLARLRDTAVNVRRQALRLFQQMVCIYALFFDVNVSQNKKFQPMEEVLREYQLAETNFHQSQQEFEDKKTQFGELKRQIEEQNGDADSDQLKVILSNDPRYQEAEQAVKNAFDQVSNTEEIYNTSFELGKFLTKMEEAGPVLVMMLSSKTIADTVEVIRVFKFLHRYGFAHTEVGIRKMLTLVYSKEQAVVNAMIECYSCLYFSQDVATTDKVKHLFALMRNATLTDITCIEELLGKLMKENAFEAQVFIFLWQVYLDPGRNFDMSGVEFDADERHQLIQACKQEQRSAIKLLRMMGTQKVDILNTMKVQLQEKSLVFANYEQPDFILLKEAILAFEKIL